MKRFLTSKCVSAGLLMLVATLGQAQLAHPMRDSVDEAPVPVHYLFPFRPGESNQLAGTLGELRSTHFHAGIDIRTNNAEGLPILATADGYVVRISSSPFGYGNALYIRHANGHTSVYAHLSQYKGEAGRYVRQEQYRRKTDVVDLYPAPDQFRVKAGDTIGLSGNTGSSNGPHLHFEIRDENNRALNPLRFGFTEVRDNVPPQAQKVALRTMDRHARVNDRFGRYEFYLVKQGSRFVLPNPILAYGRIGLELLAFDRLIPSHFRCGIQTIEVYAEEQKIFTQQIDWVSFETTRQILSVVDYATMKEKGERFNRLYTEPGVTLPFYEKGQNGIIDVRDRSVPVRIRMVDGAGNAAEVHFVLQPSVPRKQIPLLPSAAEDFHYEVTGSTLVVKVKPKDSLRALTLFERGQSHEVRAAYYSPVREAYLVNLSRFLPDSIRVHGEVYALPFAGRVPPNTPFTFYSPWFEAQFPLGALGDTLFLQAARPAGSTFTIGPAHHPLLKDVRFTVRLDSTYGPRHAVYLQDKGLSYLGGQFNGPTVTFTTRDLGRFVIREDTAPPTITRLHCHRTSARFRIRDDRSGIQSYEANINGEWLLMMYDFKTGILQSHLSDSRQVLKGRFELRVTDKVGNVKIYTQVIP